MRIKTLAITAIALLGARRTGVGRRPDPDRVGLRGRAAGAAGPLRARTRSRSTSKVHFVYTANGGNAGVKDVQNGTSQFAGQARTPLPSDAGTTYIKMYLDGLCLDVNPKNKLSNITIQQTHDIYRGLLTNWSQIPGSGLDTTIDPVGRDTNGGTYNFFLQAVLNNEAAGVQRQRADRRRPRRQRGQAGPERDRLRRPRLAGQRAEAAQGQRRPLHAEQDQRRAAQVPALALHLHRPARPAAPARRCTSSSTGRGAARWPAK